MEMKQMMEKLNSLSEPQKEMIRNLLRDESVEHLKAVLGDDGNLEEKVKILKKELGI